MDSGTHLVVGIGLAGLAYIDPAVAASSTAATAVLLGTVLGSQIPDIDTLFRLKGNAAYIRNHRGGSHSLPAIGLWTLLLTFAISLLFPVVPAFVIGKWVFIAICVHIFSDLFNAYGTQAARPFTKKWIAWNIIHIFDPFIFISHVFAIFIWMLQLADPKPIFISLYAIIILYYITRTIVYFLIKRSLPRFDTNYMNGDVYEIIPTVHPKHWNVVKKKSDGSYVQGEWRNEQLHWHDEIPFVHHPAIEASKKAEDIASFLYFTDYASADVKVRKGGYEVRWIDVRYSHRKQYPFLAVVLLNEDFEVIGSYVGWLNQSKLGKKLNVDVL